jgi:hypothetical protein
LKKKIIKILAKKKFTLKDQSLFAVTSGDKNPIHIDPVYARKTISGECIVHGINIIMWAINSLIKKTNLIPSTIKASFLKPIFLNENVLCLWKKDLNQIHIISNKILLTSIELEIGEITKNKEINIKTGQKNKYPKNSEFLESYYYKKKNFLFRGDSKYLKKIYPDLYATYGEGTLCEFLMISEIVGMEMPGLNSVFLGLNIVFNNNNSKPILKITKIDRRFKILNILIKTSYLTGELEVCFRPEVTKRLKIKKIKKLIAKNEFNKVRALIVGVSRGIGEIIAKLIACGNGKAHITYAYDINEAKKIREHLKDYGKKITLSRLIIPKDTFSSIKWSKFNQIYYCATPKIFAKRSFNFDRKLYKKFSQIYTFGFQKLIKSIPNKIIKNISVFYPSSTAIEKPTFELSEYIKTKKEGEKLCNKLNKKYKNFIIYPRIPRIKTDQTISILKNTYEKSAEKLLLFFIRKMTKRL